MSFRPIFRELWILAQDLTNDIKAESDSDHVLKEDLKSYAPHFRYFLDVNFPTTYIAEVSTCSA